MICISYSEGRVSMGSTCSPTVSKLFCNGYREQICVHVQFTTHFLETLHWWHFLYLDPLERRTRYLFNDHLNSCHPTLNLPPPSPRQVDYLEVMVKVDNDGEVYTTLSYTKQTDRQTSPPPVHPKMGWPYSQLVRIKWICTKQDWK